MGSLHDVISEAINKFVPWQLIRSQEKCPWNNKDLRKLKNAKNKEWKKYNSTGVKEPFIQAHEKFSELNNQLYKKYVDKVTSSLHNDPASFWRFVNSKKSSDSNPHILQLDETVSTNKNEHAQMFAEFFSSNFNENAQPQNSINMCNKQ